MRRNSGPSSLWPRLRPGRPVWTRATRPRLRAPPWKSGASAPRQPPPHRNIPTVCHSESGATPGEEPAVLAARGIEILRCLRIAPQGERLEGHSGVVQEQKTDCTMCGLSAARAAVLKGHGTGPYASAPQTERARALIAPCRCSDTLDSPRSSPRHDCGIKWVQPGIVGSPREKAYRFRSRR
jgi:hypothetical protein